MFKRGWKRFLGWFGAWLDARETRDFLRSVGADPETCRRVPAEEVFIEGTPGLPKQPVLD